MSQEGEGEKKEKKVASERQTAGVTSDPVAKLASENERLGRSLRREMERNQQLQLSLTRQPSWRETDWRVRYGMVAMVTQTHYIIITSSTLSEDSSAGERYRIAGIFWGGNIFVVFVVERRTTKHLPTKNTSCARPK